MGNIGRTGTMMIEEDRAKNGGRLEKIYCLHGNTEPGWPKNDGSPILPY